MKTSQIKAKHSRRDGVLLSDRASHARALQRRPYPPGVHGPNGNTRMTEYGKQLREKQKAKRMYGMQERQFRNAFVSVLRKKGNSGDMLVQQLETRLDNVVYRAGFVKTRAAARQAVSHAHFTLNGKKVNIPSIQVRPGDVIALRQNKWEKGVWKGLEENLTKKVLPSWVTVEAKERSAKIVAVPAGEELQQPFDPKLIVEFYSRQ